MPPKTQLSVCVLFCVGLNSHIIRADATVIHVAAQGKDSLARAQAMAREKIAAGLTSDVKVVVHGGVYEISEPLQFDLRDSGTEAHSVTYLAAPGEKVVISGGRRISGWKKANGKIWRTRIPEVEAGEWNFRQLFVNDKRAIRARTPNADEPSAYFQLMDAKLERGSKAFWVKVPPRFAKNWRRVQDVEILIHGNWAINRKRLESVDPAKGILNLAPPHISAIRWNQPRAGRWSCMENALEMLDRPGEWYLNRSTGELSYWPLEGQDMNSVEVVAPLHTRLIEVSGTPEKSVRNLHFRGLHFLHTEWHLPAFGYHGIQACHYSGAGNKPAGHRWPGIEPAIGWRFVDSSTVARSVLAHLGGSGIYLGRGCRNCKIRGNHVFDVAANGIMVSGPNDEKLVPQGNRLANNHVHNTGVGYFGAVGIWVGFAAGTEIVHNYVHHTPYTGISVGWNWNPQPTACKENTISNNHVHDTMLKLADGGCIYTLGFQPGTVLRENLLHDAHRGTHAHGAPNNGVFVDEGSKGFLFERNVIYKTSAEPIRFNQCRREWHTWRDNVLGSPKNDREKAIVAKVRASAGLEPGFRKR